MINFSLHVFTLTPSWPRASTEGLMFFTQSWRVLLHWKVYQSKVLLIAFNLIYIWWRRNDADYFYVHVNMAPPYRNLPRFELETVNRVFFFFRPLINCLYSNMYQIKARVIAFHLIYIWWRINNDEYFFPYIFTLTPTGQRASTEGLNFF